jgi:hypothetical protein
MAWERRGEKYYFYLSRRVDGRVQKRYIGRGLPANLADRMVAEGKLDRRQQDRSLAAMKAELEPADRLADELDDVARRLTEEALVAAGFRRVNYSWRRRRNVTGKGRR